MEENVKVELEGYAYHPNLLDFSLAALFGLQQREFEDVFSGRERTSANDGDVLEFDFTGQFLKKKPFPVTVFARRHRSLDPRPFQPSIETTSTTYGLRWQYVDARMPIHIQFTNNEVELDALGGNEEDGHQRNTLFRFDIAYNFSEFNTLSFVYDYRSLDEDPFAFNYDSHEMSLSHNLAFGPNHQRQLDSEIDYFSQRGTFNIERLRWRETLRLQHSETLRSWYRWEFLDRTQGTLSGVPPIDERSYFLTGTLEHKWYESLITQVLGFGQLQEFGSGLRIQRYGAQASFDYRKKNRWGVLRGNYRIRYQNEDRSGGDQFIEILDERHTFRDPEPTVLQNTNVQLSSIFITGEDRTTIFQSGRDYRVTEVGDRVEIRRVPTGRILDGTTVLIDYSFFIRGSFALETFAQTVNLRQDFDSGWSPYYRYRRQDQTISPLLATGAIADDITAHLGGLELRRGPLRLLAEYEDHDSTINPFEAIRLSGDLTRRFKNGSTGVLKTRWSHVRHDDPSRETKFLTIEARYRHPLTPRLNLEGAITYRREKDSLTGNDEGIDVDLSLEWKVRETEVLITFDYGRFDDAFVENDFSALYVQIRRRF